MKGRGLLFLLAICVGMGLYLYFGVQKPSETREANKDKESKLARGDLSQLQHLVILANGQKIELERTQTSRPIWKLVAPVKDLAAAGKIDNLVSALGRFKKSKVVMEKSEVLAHKDKLAQYNLTPPKLNLEYKTSDLSEPVHLLLGGSNPTSTGVYSQVGGADSEVVLATMDLDFLNTQVPDDFREMRLTTVEANDVAEVEMISKGKRMKFVRDADDKWTMSAPYSNLPIDTEFTRSELQKINFVRANKFLETSPEALKNPDIKIVLGFKEKISDERSTESDKRPNGAEIVFARAAQRIPTLKVKGAAPVDPNDQFDYYAKSDKTQAATIARYHYDNFLKTPEDYIRKTFEIFDIAQIKRLTLQHGKTASVQAIKNGEAYEVTQGAEKKPGLKEPIEAALRQFRQLRAVKFTSTFDKPPTADFAAEIETADGKIFKFTFQMNKDFADLWFVDGATKIRYLLGKDPLKLKELDFASLTTPPAPKPTPSPTPNVDSKLDQVKDLVNPSKESAK